MTPTRLDAARLEAIGENVKHAIWSEGVSPQDAIDLLGHIAALEAEVAQLRAQLAEGRRC